MDVVRYASRSRSVLIGAGAIALAVLVGATALSGATPLKVNKGTTERGYGQYVGFSNVGSWWTFAKMTLAVAPVAGSAASSLVGTPTGLPRNGTVDLYVGGATAGATVFLWAFGASPTSTPSTELELRFNASWPGGGYSVVVYLETPTPTPTSTVMVRLYAPVPSLTLSTVTLESYVESSQACSGIGSCP